MHILIHICACVCTHAQRDTHAFTAPYTYTGLEQAGLELIVFPLSLSSAEITYVHYHIQPNIVNISVVFQLSV